MKSLEATKAFFQWLYRPDADFEKIKEAYLREMAGLKERIQARERQWVETQIGDVPMREAEG